MNYHNGFTCTAEVQSSAFVDHNYQSTWSTPPNLPPTWEPASYINSTVSFKNVSIMYPINNVILIICACFLQALVAHIIILIKTHFKS